MEQPRNSRIAEDRCGVVVGAARVERMLQVEAPVVDRDVGARARVPDPAEATCRPAVTGIADAEAQCGVDDEAAPSLPFLLPARSPTSRSPPSATSMPP